MTTPDPVPVFDAARRAPFQKAYVYGPAPLPRASLRDIAATVVAGTALIGIAAAGIYRLNGNGQAETARPVPAIATQPSASAPGAPRYAPWQAGRPMPPPPVRNTSIPAVTRLYLPQPPSPYDSFNRSAFARRNGLVMGPRGPYNPSNPQAGLPGQGMAPGQGQGMAPGQGQGAAPGQGGMPQQQYEPNGGEMPRQTEARTQQPEMSDPSQAAAQNGEPQAPADGAAPTATGQPEGTAATATGQPEGAAPDTGGQTDPQNGAPPSQDIGQAPSGDQQPSPGQ